jgi:ADP-ribose pyrophosphatase YjhB (NUDIX family)
MPLAERSRRAVERRLARLRADYLAVPLETATVENDHDFVEAGRELVERGAIGRPASSSGPRGRVLLGNHSGRAAWAPPGGGHEPGETLEETAHREVRGETGVGTDVVGVYHARRKRFVDRTDPGRRDYLPEIVFAAEHVAGTPDEGDDDEVAAAARLERPPEPVVDLAAERSGAWRDVDGPSLALPPYRDVELLGQRLDQPLAEQLLGPVRASDPQPVRVFVHGDTDLVPGERATAVLGPDERHDPRDGLLGRLEVERESLAVRLDGQDVRREPFSLDGFPPFGLVLRQRTRDLGRVRAAPGRV